MICFSFLFFLQEASTLAERMVIFDLLKSEEICLCKFEIKLLTNSLFFFKKKMFPDYLVAIGMILNDISNDIDCY